MVPGTDRRGGAAGAAPCAGGAGGDGRLDLAGGPVKTRRGRVRGSPAASSHDPRDPREGDPRMALHDVKLSLRPCRGTVQVDGRELGGVRSLSLDAGVDEIPRLSLDLVAPEVEVDGEMTVIVTDEVRQTLTALGWTPPQEA